MDYTISGDLDSWARTLLDDPDMALMGHAQSVRDANLGMGWIYYGLARALRPRLAVVIGSWRGFVPLVLARALADNQEPGKVLFIDPSRVDDFWKSPARVARHFAKHGAGNVRHECVTTQEFVASHAFREMGNEVGLLFIDGYHTREQAAFDYESFRPRLSPDALVLFHESRRDRLSRIYGEGREYEQRVHSYVETLRARPELEVLSLQLGDGLTLLRHRSP